MCHRLLCFGDSNTYGYDPRSYLGGRYPQTVRWTALLNAEGWQVINEGENGRSIPRADWEIKTAIQAIHRAKAEALLIVLGSNDLLQCPGLAADVCAERMEHFLGAILAEKNIQAASGRPTADEAGSLGEQSEDSGGIPPTGWLL